MFDPLRAKARVIITVAVGFVGGLALASGLGWTGLTYAMPTITQVPTGLGRRRETSPAAE
jgi:hypothetical protein